MEPIKWMVDFMENHGQSYENSWFFMGTSIFWTPPISVKDCVSHLNECAQWCQKPIKAPDPVAPLHLNPCWLATSVLEIHRTWHFAAVALAAPQQKSGGLVCWCRMNFGAKFGCGKTQNGLTIPSCSFAGCLSSPTSWWTMWFQKKKRSAGPCWCLIKNLTWYG